MISRRRGIGRLITRHHHRQGHRGDLIVLLAWMLVTLFGVLLIMLLVGLFVGSEGEASPAPTATGDIHAHPHDYNIAMHHAKTTTASERLRPRGWPPDV